MFALPLYSIISFFYIFIMYVYMQPCTNCDGKCNTAAVIVTASNVIVIEQYELVIVIGKTK